MLQISPALRARAPLWTITLALVVLTGCQVTAQQLASSPSEATGVTQSTPRPHVDPSSPSHAQSPLPTQTPYVLPSPRGGFVQPNAPRWHFWAERFNGEVASVTEWHGQLIAVGTEGQANLATQARPMISRMWTSANASEWNRVDLPEDVRKSGFGAVYTSAAGDLVAIGKFAAWRSPDTQNWTAIDVPTVSDPLVAAGSSGYLMTDRALDNSPLWESEDGIDWRPLALPGIEDSPRILSMASGDSGQLVSACKLDVESELVDSCRIYSSSDGVTWTPTEWLPTQVHVAWTGHEWLAAGYIHDETERRIQLWRAGDKFEWVGSGRITEGFVNPIVDRLLVAGEKLVMKTGTSYTRSMFSLDGDSWVPSGLQVYLRNAAALGDELVVTGSTFEGRAGIWRLVVAEP